MRHLNKWINIVICLVYLKTTLHIDRTIFWVRQKGNRYILIIITWYYKAKEAKIFPNRLGVSVSLTGLTKWVEPGDRIEFSHLSIIMRLSCYSHRAIGSLHANGAGTHAPAAAPTTIGQDIYIREMLLSHVIWMLASYGWKKKNCKYADRNCVCIILKVTHDELEQFAHKETDKWNINAHGNFVNYWSKIVSIGLQQY